MLRDPEDDGPYAGGVGQGPGHSRSLGCDLTPGRRNPHDGFGRSQHGFLAQRHNVQVRGFKRRAREVLGLFLEGRLRLLEDFGA